MSSINGVNVGYTQSGNPYQKSNTGKNVGTTFAVGLSAAGMTVPYKALSKVYSKNPGFASFYKDVTKAGFKNPLHLMKSFISDGKGTMAKLLGESRLDLTAQINKMLKDGTKTQKVVAKIVSNKFARATVMGGAVALGLATSIAIWRGIGAIYDKIVNHGAKKQADFVAQKA